MKNLKLTWKTSN